MPEIGLKNTVERLRKYNKGPLVTSYEIIPSKHYVCSKCGQRFNNDFNRIQHEDAGKCEDRVVIYIDIFDIT